MKSLSDNELKILKREIDSSGLTYVKMRNELLDHLCCCIEEKMLDGLDFPEALLAVRAEMGKNCIRYIQEDTLFLVNQKYRTMKKLMYIMGIVAPVLLLLAAILKIQHWPGAGPLLVFGWSLLAAVYIPAFIIVKIRDTRKEGKKVKWGLYISGMVSGIIIIAGTLFKIMHWPGAGFMISLAGLVSVLVFIPVLIINTVNDKVNQVQSFTILVFVLSFLALTYMTTSLNISKSVLGAFRLPLDNNKKITAILEKNNGIVLNRLETIESPLADSIKSITEQADELSSYIIGTMQILVTACDSHNSDVVNENGEIDFVNLRKKEEADISSRIMLGIDHEPRGQEIARRMNSLRNSIINLGDEKLSMMADQLLSTSVPDKVGTSSWVFYSFEHLPMVSILLQLSNIRVNTGLLEAEVLSRMAENDDDHPIN
ncbi:MAG: GldL-related protein [Bacteroidota bacterium]